MTSDASQPVPSAAELASLRDLAIEVAVAAAALIVDERPTDLGVEHTKSSRTDVVTVMDQRAQDLLVELLRAARPHDSILGEEQGGVTGTSGLTWVIDPIDGTVNYLYGIGSYAVSVAVVRGDAATAGQWQPLAAAVVDASTGEVFSAALGGGARRESTHGGGTTTELVATAETDLALALVATGFGYASATRAWQADLLREILTRIRDIRRFGSAALDLCRVAAGEVDAYYESGLNPWDFAAGWLIATEAGVRVGGPGDTFDPDGALLWACAPTLADEFGGLIRELTARHTQPPG